jgi:phenylpropionate dioxygenase-like ring-hydroxylating dioxygenase large terminal subunit
MIMPVAEMGTSFSRSDWEILSHFWYPVAFSHELKAAPLAVTLLDQKLVAYRHSQGVTVARNICLHRGVPLSMGWLEGDELVCKYHGFRYAPDGHCTETPAHPGVVIPPKLCLETFPAVEKYGLVWTCLNPSSEPALPDFHEWDDPDYVRVLPDAWDIKAAAGRQLEGFLDVAHFAWIHTGTFGDRTNTIVPRYEVEPLVQGLRAEYVSTVSNFTPEMRHRAPPDFLWSRTFEVTLPFSARLTVKFPDEGARLCILNACCPVSSRLTKLFVPIAQNFDKDLPEEVVRDFNHRVFAEDQEIVEAQCPEDLPIDLTEEVHIRADRTSIEYRKALGRLGLGRSYTS